MPVWEAELSDGRIAELESDHEPTEDEVLAAVQGQPNQPDPVHTLDAQRLPGMDGLIMPTLDDSLLPRHDPRYITKAGVPIEPPVPEPTWGTGFREELKQNVGDVVRGGLGFIPSALRSIGVAATDPKAALSSIGRNVLDFVAPGEMSVPRTPSTSVPEQHPAYQAGETSERMIDELFPRRDDAGLGTSVREGLGQMGSMLAAGGAVRALGAGVPATTAAATTLGGVMEFDDAFKRARERKDDPDTAFAKALGYATVASLLENRLGAGRVLRQIFPSAAEAAKKITALGVSKKIAGNFVAGGAEEGAQRAAQNWIVEEKPSLEGVLGEALPGAIVQGITSLPGAGVVTRERTPDAVQPESAQVLRPVLQSKVAQEGEVQVPTTESGEKIDETLARDVLYKEAESAKKQAESEWPPQYKKIKESTGASESELDALGITEVMLHPSEYRNLSRELSRNAPGGKLNQLYNRIAPEGKTGRFIWGGTAENPKLGFEPDIRGAVPDAASARRALDIVNKVKESMGDVPLPDFFSLSSSKLPDKLTPQVSEFVSEFTKTEGQAKISNDSANPDMITTNATGEAVNSMSDLNALLEANVNARNRLRELRDIRGQRELTPQEASEFFRLAGTIQFPREVIERATNIGSGSQEMRRPWEKAIEPKLDWKKNPQVRQWLLDNAEKIWSDDPLIQNKATLEKGGETIEKAKETEVLTETPAPAVGFFPRESEAQGLGEYALPPTVETVRQQREQDKRESGIAPGEKTTPSQGQWFSGLNPRETGSMMQNRANTFLEGKTDEQAIVDLARMAGGDPGVQLDNQAANFAIKDLLVRINAKINSTKNPVYHAEAWAQIDRLAELSRRLGAEDARSLVSRRLAYRQIDWLMPVLAFRGIVQDKWRKALGLPPGAPIAGKDTEEASKKLKLPRMDGPEMEKMRELAKRAKNEPQGVRRNKTLEEMVKLLQSQTSMSKLDLLRDVWYGSVLARVGTMLNVLAGSYATGASFTALAALDRIARLHPVQAMKIVGQFIGGTIEGTLIADQIARKGAYHLLPDAEQRMINLLSGKSGARFDNLEALLKRGNPVGVLAYTRRFMAALDYIGALGTRDSQVLYGALSRGDQESLDALDKRSDKALNQQAEQQAKTEMGPKASRAEVLVRKREILEEGVAEDIKEQSVQTARRAAQNADPRGIPGLLYKMAAKLPFWVKAPTGLAFMRSAMNMVQNASDYMPGIGAVSALRGKMGSLPENHPLHRFGMDIPLEERRMIWAAQGASLGIAAIAAAMFLGDDDDEGLEISGSWKGLTPQKKSQLMDLGERPNSIRFGKKGPWISFKQMPFAPPLAMIGTMRDQERFNNADWDAESAADKLTAAWLGGILYIKDISSLSGVAGLFDLNAWSTQESPTKLKEKANKLAAQSVGRAAAGYIPSVIKEIDEFGDQTLYRPSKDEMSGWWIRNVPYARRTVGPGPALNNFGEPIQLTPPPIKSWAGFGKDTDLYNALGQLASRGVFTPEPGRSAKIVDDQGVYRDMTENEWYEFVKKRGPMFKEAIEANLEILKEGSSKESIEMLRDMSEKASAAARLDMFPLSRYRSLRKEQEQ